MSKTNDLRSVLEMLKGIDGQLIETDVEVDPHAELCGVYRYIGAGGTVMRPTHQNGPAMVFNNVKGHPDARVAIGVLASRERVGYILGEKPERLGYKLMEAVSNPIPPTEVPNEGAPCQEIVHLSTDPGFDIRELIPAPTNTEEDAGPYITMGLCYATDPETGKKDITIHRLCLQSKDTISFTSSTEMKVALERRKSSFPTSSSSPFKISCSPKNSGRFLIFIRCVSINSSNLKASARFSKRQTV